ncbi:MAG: T9SS type A sorting domain-containing protein [bacterium]|nr:T9SS type A sorting domain-containing protein [bacterium]
MKILVVALPMIFAVSVANAQAPGTPVNVVAVAMSDTSATVTWEPTAPFIQDGFTVIGHMAHGTLPGFPGGALPPEATSYIFRNLICGERFTFEVIAFRMINGTEWQSGIAPSNMVVLSQCGAHPIRLTLHQNYPNPFNPSTTIRFSTPKEGMAQLVVFNALGEQVAILVHEPLPAGDHAVTFDANHLAAGVYIYRLKTASTGRPLWRKMILVK